MSERVNSKHIMQIQGRDFVKFEGLLELWITEVNGSIKTELIQAPTAENGNTTIFKATVSGGGRRVCIGHGDANPSNVNKMIAPHAIRMAETRAIARALRLYLAIGMTTLEELGGTECECDGGQKSPPKPQQIVDDAKKVFNIENGKNLNANQKRAALSQILNKCTEDEVANFKERYTNLAKVPAESLDEVIAEYSQKIKEN